MLFSLYATKNFGFSKKKQIFKPRVSKSMDFFRKFLITILPVPTTIHTIVYTPQIPKVDYFLSAYIVTIKGNYVIY